MKRHAAVPTEPLATAGQDQDEQQDKLGLKRELHAWWEELPSACPGCTAPET